MYTELKASQREQVTRNILNSLKKTEKRCFTKFVGYFGLGRIVGLNRSKQNGLPSGETDARTQVLSSLVLRFD